MSPCERLMRALGLSADELDALVGTDAAELATVQAVVELLEVKLKPDRLAQVVRRPAAVFGSRSLLDAMRDGEQDRVLDVLRASFQWDQPA